MDEQKRLLLAVVLSILVLLGYQFFFVPPQPKLDNPPQNTQIQDEQPQKAAAPAPETPQSNVSDIKEEFPKPVAASPAPTDFRTISLSTPLYNIRISEHRAAVTSLELASYKETVEPDSPLKQLVSKELVKGVFYMDTEKGSIRDLSNAVFRADTPETDLTLDSGEKTLTFSWTNPAGITVRKILTFKADSYLIGCKILIQNGSAASVNDNLTITVPGPFHEGIKKRSRFAFEGPVAYIDGKFTTIKPDSLKKKDTYTGKVGWSGYTSRYFLTAIMPQDPVNGVLKLKHANDVVTNTFVQELDRLDPGKQEAYDYTLYMGPKSLKVLSQYGTLLSKSINFGWFDIIAKPLLMGMNLIHDVIPNYGVAIILLTIIVKLIFWPLGTKSYKSMNEMKKVQPLMTEIREKYKDDKQRMNQEIMGLYKTYKVNPASGCLPMLVQMPIFFALYRMLYMAIELRHAPFVGWIRDLSGPDRLFHFSFAIPMMQPPYGIPVLTLLMGASFLFQQKMTPTGGDPMQAKMMMLMPLFMTVLFINFPAGLVLYMLVNNIISMGQQLYTQKKFA